MTDDPNVQESVKVDIPQIAGFWRRISAFALDGVVLGGFGLGLGLLWFDRLAALGSGGRFFGGGIALAYFSVLNSRIGHGQTLAKRALKIRVLDANGKTVSLSRSLLRSFVLLVPITLNGAYVPAGDGGSPGLVILGLCTFGLGGALAYLYLFNRRTRQSLHDLVAGTFVVNAQSSGEIELRVWKPHLAMVLTWLLFIGVGVGPLANRLAGPGMFQQLTRLQRTVEAAAPGTRVAVQKGTETFTNFRTGRSSAQFVRVRVVTSVKPASAEELADRVAAAVLSNAQELEDVDRLAVSIAYGYDIMISNAYTTSNFAHSPREWSDRLKLD